MGSEKCLTIISDYQRKAQSFAKDILEILQFNTSERLACKKDYLKLLKSRTTDSKVSDSNFIMQSLNYCFHHFMFIQCFFV